MSFRIVRARKRDASCCKKIICKCIDGAKKLSSSEKNYLKKYYNLKNLERLITNSYFLVIKLNNKVIGTGRIKNSKIATLYIDPDYHLRGLGTLMLKRLELRAKRSKVKTLTLNSLLQSVGFYEKNGFKRVRLFRKPITSFQMRKKI